MNEAISDPLKQRIDAEELAKMEEARKPKPVTPNVEIVPPEGDEIQLPDDIDFDQDMSAVAVADAFGGPPKEILDQMTQDEKLGIIDNSND